jgi:PKHD-type hydroxylase
VSNYPFVPAVQKGRSPSFAWWEGAFTDEEIEKIKEYAKTLATNTALVNTGEGPPLEQIRKTKVSWISNTPEASWIYDGMAGVASKLNAQYYNFDLYGFLEDMQFTIYEETESHYTWHMDMGDNSKAPRKISMVLQLSDPSEYEGGELQILDKAEPETINKQKGLITLFPSYTLHRVTPVTKGVRYSLVVWVCGPALK